MSANQPTEEELRAAYEQQMKAVRVEQIVIEDLVTVLNLGLRRTGVIEGSEDERDPTQVQVAIEAVRSLLPLVEQIAPEQGPAIRQALSQLQMAYVQSGGGGTLQSPAPAPASAAEPGPQASPQQAPRQAGGSDSRLWIPGR